MSDHSGPGPGPGNEPPPGSPSPAHSGETTVGLAPNVAGALAYLLGPFTGIFFLVMEKRSYFVRFHAAQALGVSVAFIVAGVGLSLATAILGVIPVVGWIVTIPLVLASMLLGLGGFLLWIYLMLQALGGKEWEVPYIGERSREMLLEGSGPPT